MNRIIRMNDKLIKAFSNRNVPDIKFVPSTIKESSLKQSLEFITETLNDILDLFANEIIKLAALFLSNKIDSECYNQICQTKTLPILTRYLFGRKFLSPKEFTILSN